VFVEGNMKAADRTDYSTGQTYRTAVPNSSHIFSIVRWIYSITQWHW